MNRIRKVSGIFLLVSILSFSGNHMMAQWVATGGPEGGYISSLADDDLFLYAATFGPIYKLDKEETVWIPLQELYGASSLAVIGSTLIAGLDGGGVYRSTDHGATWSRWISGLHPGSNVFSFAVNGGDLFAGTDRGVYLSTDYGANWTPMNSGQDDLPVLSLLVKNSNIFAGTMGGGVYRSIDYGLSWIPINNGLKNENVWVTSLVAISDTLFAGTWWEEGVYRSTNNGAAWTAVNDGLLNPDVNTLAVLDTTLIAGTCGGVFHSEDSGENWTLFDDAPGSNVSCFHVSDTNIYAATNYGVYLSSDTGNSWESSYAGLVGSVINVLFRTSTTLFAGTANCGLFRSDNDGANWDKQNLYTSSITSMVESGTNIFAGTSNGVSRSADGGNSWILANNGLKFEKISSLAVISGGKGSEYLFAGADTSGVFLSMDKGDTWARVNTGLTDTLVQCLAVSNTTLFAGTGSGVFMSTNFGINWTPVNTGLTTSSIQCLTVNNGNLFAGTGSGIYFSENNGTNWTPINTGLTDLNILCLVASGTTLFAGTWFDRVYLSENNGNSWTLVNTGLEDISVLSLDLTDTDVFAGTRGSGVWRSPLSGIITSVNLYSNGLPSEIRLEQNFPNPFHHNTKIRFTIPFQTNVLLKVFDQFGREVAILVNKELPAGTYEELFNGNHLSSGLYYYRLQAGEFTQTRKLMLLW